MEFNVSPAGRLTLRGARAGAELSAISSTIALGMQAAQGMFAVGEGLLPDLPMV
jgi:hypothetical protein